MARASSDGRAPVGAAKLGKNTAALDRAGCSGRPVSPLCGAGRLRRGARAAAVWSTAARHEQHRGRPDRLLTAPRVVTGTS